MGKIIICPKCGEIPYYTNFEIQKVYLAFDANGNEVDTALDTIGLRDSIIPRCCYCDKKVKIVEE